MGDGIFCLCSFFVLDLSRRSSLLFGQNETSIDRYSIEVKMPLPVFSKGFVDQYYISEIKKEGEGNYGRE
jgi:hypothetical protein